MLDPGLQTRFFDPSQAALLHRYAGQFAVVYGRRLLGIRSSLELALQAAAGAFDDGTLEEGAPILISEIAEPTRLRAVAETR